jgi:hypothetical protein
MKGSPMSGLDYRIEFRFDAVPANTRQAARLEAVQEGPSREENLRKIDAFSERFHSSGTAFDFKEQIDGRSADYLGFDGTDHFSKGAVRCRKASG